MELKGKDGYKIESLFTLSNDQTQALMLCYQACMGATAVALYLTLISEAHGQRGFEQHQRICALMGIDIIAFEHARKVCEEYNLIKTFYHESEVKNNYIYVLKPTLLVEEFINHGVFGRRYLQIVGSKAIEVTKAIITKPVHDKSNYKNITKKFNVQLLQNWDKEDEVSFSKVKPTYTINQAMESHIKFDYDKFLQESSNLSFPIEARTKEALQVIGELATIYGINSDRMRIMVGHCVNNSTNVLDIQKLKNLAWREKPTPQKSKNKWDISPVLFLQNYQDGIEVSKPDAKILENLITKFRLKQEVVNVLIEAILLKNNNRLNTAYVEKIATSWVRNHINTLEAAQTAAKEIAVKQSSYTPRKASLPKSFEKEAVKDQPLNEQEQKAIHEKLKRLEEN